MKKKTASSCITADEAVFTEGEEMCEIEPFLLRYIIISAETSIEMAGTRHPTTHCKAVCRLSATHDHTTGTSSNAAKAK